MNLNKPLKIHVEDEEVHEESIKACFDEIYTKADPREYYRVLYGLDYIIPDLARGIFRNVANAVAERRDRPIKVLDLGCSYGSNAILLRMPLDLARLAQRYADLGAHGLTASELAELDCNYFRSWPRQPMTIVGLDASAPAIAYAVQTAALDDGIALDLENGELTPRARALLRDVDLIISTGCVGYVTERTFSQILDAIEGPAPWIASFVLRMYPYTAIETELSRRGLATEKLEGTTFVQRRFHSERECWDVLRCLEQAGISTLAKESEGLLHAEFYLSRSPADATAVPLEQVASVTNGDHHTFGRRYRRVSDKVLLFGKYASAVG
jgi:SAM-dependent methyltransferase